MEVKHQRILLAGPSGVGKTTVANYLAEEMGLKFISGSVSDLLPKTKEMPHAEMLARDSKDLYMEDFQILNLRNKLYGGMEEPFVSDRSFLDSAAYFLYKQADKVPACEVEHFLELAKMSTLKHCDCLILFEYTQEMFNDWVIEDNKKRVTSKYFQMEISRIMDMVLDLWGVKWDHYRVQSLRDHTSNSLIGRIFGTELQLGNSVSIGELSSLYGTTTVLVIREANKQLREKILKIILNEKF